MKRSILTGMATLPSKSMGRCNIDHNISFIFKYLLLAFLLAISAPTRAQQGYDVSGTVADDSKLPVHGATVFISGTKWAMPTNADGHFKFINVTPGVYKLVVKMLGNKPVIRQVKVDRSSLHLQIKLVASTTALKQVQIGSDRSWYKNFELFKLKFLGRSANARSCVITNPKVINFSTRKGVLQADADDLLVIENRRLGYRIRYLLRSFEHNRSDNVSQYNGECSFEEMIGSQSQKQQWAKNRAEAYTGSFRQFLRTVYTGSCIENGFLVREFLDYGIVKGDSLTQDTYKLVVIDSALNVENLTVAMEGNVKSLVFKQLYVIHDHKKVAKYKYFKPVTKVDVERSTSALAIPLRSTTIERPTTIVRDLNSSVIRLNNDHTFIDVNGSYPDHRDFFIKGRWGDYRMGDELPADYVPPVPDKPKEKLSHTELLKDIERVRAGN